METPDNIGCGLGRRYKTLRLNSGFTGSLGFISISTGYMHAACMKSSLNVPGFDRMCGSYAIYIAVKSTLGREDS